MTREEMVAEIAADKIKAGWVGDTPPAAVWMRAQMEVEALALEQHDEFLRIRTEDREGREAKAQARRERGELEKVLVEKRRIEAAYQEPQVADAYLPDMPVTESTPTYEKLCNLKLPLAQWALWENQFVPQPIGVPLQEETKSLIRGEAKRPYMDQTKFFMVPTWITRELLPVMKPRLALVLLVFYQLADQAGCFKISQRRLAEKTGIARGHLQSLVKLLVDSTVVQIPKKGRGHRVHRYRLAPVEEINLRFVRKTLWKEEAPSRRPKHDDL